MAIVPGQRANKKAARGRRDATWITTIAAPALSCRQWHEGSQHGLMRNSLLFEPDILLTAPQKCGPLAIRKAMNVAGTSVTATGQVVPRVKSSPIHQETFRVREDGPQRRQNLEPFNVEVPPVNDSPG